jgi:hypothetical protein
MPEPIVVGKMIIKQHTDYSRAWDTPGNYSVISVKPGEYPVFYAPNDGREIHCPLRGTRTLDSYIVSENLGGSSPHEEHPNVEDVYHLRDYMWAFCGRVTAGECILVEGIRMIGESAYSRIFEKRKMYWQLERYDSVMGWVRII